MSHAAAEEVHKKYGVYSPFKNYPGPYPYPAACVSINEELVHGIPGPRKFVEGDIVSVGLWYRLRRICWRFRLYLRGWWNIRSKETFTGSHWKNPYILGSIKCGPVKDWEIFQPLYKITWKGSGLQVTREIPTWCGTGNARRTADAQLWYPGNGHALKSRNGDALEPMVLIGTPLTKVVAR